LEEATSGGIVWSDTAGIRQVVRIKPISNPLSLLSSAYHVENEHRRVA
jgi:hypothetical protein